MLWPSLDPQIASLSLDQWQGWHFWILAAFAIVILEMLTSGFVLGCLAFGCFGAAIADMLGLHSLAPQIWICTGLTFASFFLIRPVIMRTTRGVDAATGIDSMVGQVVTVLESSLEPNVAEAKINGEAWRIQSSDGSSLRPGDIVRVTGVNGNRLMVERQSAQSHEAPSS